MTARISTWVRQQPLIAFYALAFAITWLGWVPQAAHSHGLFPFDSPLFYILGGVGPLLAAFIVLSVLRGKSDYEDLFRPLMRWRVGVIWYLVALFGYAALWIIAITLRGELATELEKLGPPLALIQVFLVSLLAAVPEEVAWRGFALPRFQARYNALTASLIVGVLWALWHLPLLLTQGTVMSSYPLVPYLFKVVAVSVIYTWIFNSTRGSLLIVTLFHAASNTVGPFAGLEQTLVFALAAAALILVFRPAHLSHQGERLEQKDAPVVAGTVRG